MSPGTMFEYRFLTALALGVHCYIALWSGVFGVLTLFVLLIWSPFTAFLALAYTILIYYEWNYRPAGRGWYRFQKCKFFQLVSDYYPIDYELDRIKKITPDKNYIAAAHPHGVLALTSFMALIRLHKLLHPHFKIYGASNKYNCCMPLQREYFLSMGFVSASEKTLKVILTEMGTGNMIAITPGGIEEMLETETGVQKTNIKNRKGFCRLALLTGASLIPSYSFGETDTMELISLDSISKGSFTYYMRWLYQFVTKTSWILVTKPPRYLVPGLMGFPKRVPIKFLWGPPIHVDKVENPTKEQIDALHEKYVQAITDLFEEGKKYLRNPNTKLLIVGNNKKAIK